MTLYFANATGMYSLEYYPNIDADVFVQVNYGTLPS